MASVYASMAIVCFAIAASFWVRLGDKSARRIHIIAHLLLGLFYLSLWLHAYQESSRCLECQQAQQRRMWNVRSGVKEGQVITPQHGLSSCGQSVNRHGELLLLRSCAP
jgi:hypothetical protein